MGVRPINTDADCEKALAEIDEIFGARPGTPEGDRLEALIALVEAYEDEHHPISLEDGPRTC